MNRNIFSKVLHREKEEYMGAKDFLFNGHCENPENIRIFYCPECHWTIIHDCTYSMPTTSCQCNPDYINGMIQIGPGYINQKRGEK